MKKSFKKIISLSLVLIMLFSLAPLNVDPLIFKASAANATNEDFSFYVSDGEAQLNGCSENLSGDVVVPSTYGEYPVTYISMYTFSDCHEITSITIPSSVKGLSADAFTGTPALENIYVAQDSEYFTSIDGVLYSKNGTYLYYYPSAKKDTSLVLSANVAVIDSYAFYSDSSLESITVDENNISYSSENGVLFDKNKTQIVLYPDKKADKTYTIPDTVNRISQGAFKDCIYLEEVKIPSSVTEIPWYAFESATALKSAEIPSGVTYIGTNAFKSTAIKNVVIPDSVTRIGDSAFSYCSCLESASVPDSVKYLGGTAFAYCSSLENITIGDGLESVSNSIVAESGYYNNPDNWENGVLYIGKYLISASTDLQGEYTVKDGTLIIAERAFRSCKKLESVIIPDSVVTIDDYAFWCCEGLENVVVGDGVKTIGEFAFSWCYGLEDIELGENVETIGQAAFYYCFSLNGIVFPASVKSIGGGMFGENYSNVRTVFLNPETVIYDAKGTLDPESIIMGYEGSTAQAYAEKYGRDFVVLGDCIHDVVIYPEVKASCGVNGSTRSAVCTSCGEVLIKAEVIPSNDHIYLHSGNVKATCTQQGYDVYTCHCGAESYDNYVDATGHIDNNGDGYCDYCALTMENSDDNSQSLNFFQKIKQFFQNIINWIKNLFS